MDWSTLKPLIESQTGIKLTALLQAEKHETINKNLVADSNRGKLFIKYNNGDVASRMFQTEKLGLDLIRSTGVITVPEAYAVIEDPDCKGASIILKYLENMKAVEATMMGDLGARIARLHKYNLELLKTTDKKRNASSITKCQQSEPVRMFGFSSEVFYGPHFSIPADTWYDSWTDLFSREILAPQFRTTEMQQADRELSELWSQLQLVIGKFFQHQDVQPSLCVGDLASDNVGQVDNKAVLFDPYCIYGHHEFDLTQPFLTGDFTPSFYTAYHQVLPQRPGFKHRKVLYRVFGCMVRYNYGMLEYRDHAVEAMKHAIRLGREIE